MRIEREQWLELRDAHQRIVDEWVNPRLERRLRNEKHPVDDFLFDYYPISPAKLRAWHPGSHVTLEALPPDVADFASKIYEYDRGNIAVRASWVDQMQPAIDATLNHLERIATNAPRGGCHALHEWAMVLGNDVIRHQQFPLRLSQGEIRQTVDSLGLRCTHFDAFRFFTPEAQPLNPLQLSRSIQLDYDQPNCLHANMDVYKHAHALAPIVGSDVVRETFQLAREIRDVDMQVAPYDLTALGVQPIQIETAQGRAQFATLQAQFAQRAAKLRAQLISLTRTRVTAG